MYGFTLMVMTVPARMLSSMTRRPFENFRYSFTMGRPEPTPFMYWRISCVAEVKPGICARSLSSMPGPWSEKRIVLPWSMMEMHGSRKRAWMKFSVTCKMTV